MKKIIYLLLFLTLIIGGCKKSDTEINVVEDSVTFFSADKNTIDAVVTTISNSSSKTKIWCFGSFGADGLHTSINSLLIDDLRQNFYTTIILDNSKRPTVLYNSTRNNQKENVLLTFQYPSSDTVVYNLYYYDWATGSDSLLQQQKININTMGSVRTFGTTATSIDYWVRTASEIGSISSNLKKVLNSVLYIKEISNSIFDTKNMKASGATSLLLYNILEKARQQVQVQLNLKGPVSIEEYKQVDNSPFANLANESASKAGNTIPNPTGTPAHPKGSLLYGTWKIISFLSPNPCTPGFIDNWLITEGQPIKTPCGVTITGQFLCIKDDLYVFKADRVLEINAGLIKCPLPQQPLNFIKTYTINQNNQSIEIQNKSLLPYGAYAPVIGYGTYEILQLDSKILKLNLGGHSGEVIFQRQ